MFLHRCRKFSFFRGKILDLVEPQLSSSFLLFFSFILVEFSWRPWSYSIHSIAHAKRKLYQFITIDHTRELNQLNSQQIDSLHSGSPSLHLSFIENYFHYKFKSTGFKFIAVLWFNFLTWARHKFNSIRLWRMKLLKEKLTNSIQNGNKVIYSEIKHRIGDELIFLQFFFASLVFGFIQYGCWMRSLSIMKQFSHNLFCFLFKYIYI